MGWKIKKKCSKQNNQANDALFPQIQANGSFKAVGSGSLIVEKLEVQVATIFMIHLLVQLEILPADV